MVYPLPAVLVSCGVSREEYNLITVAWTGTVCTEPPMCYISMRKDRHSYGIISRTRECVINLTTEALARATDWCGVNSGRDHDKFTECGITPEPSAVVSAPSLAESPVSIECRVNRIIPLGSHDMFLLDVVNVAADPKYIDKSGRFNMRAAGLISYCHGEYFSLGKVLGFFGWSVSTRKISRR
ncbi:MAG: flavin reductase family protein [Muribaculum sp.]|uniref:Flavin reductase family protein n=1 Tax=Candidatus Merdivivens faecigallinarum TaxID=2840871 RepID=A0A9D9J233_9BACT|nr:flavin reductase family protein [Candidatus Merdivivens faecigallinarum]